MQDLIKMHVQGSINIRSTKSKIQERQLKSISVFVSTTQAFRTCGHEEKDTCIHYWKCYLNVAFWACYTPIRLVWNSETGSYSTIIHHFYLPIFVILSICTHISMLCNMAMKLLNFLEAAKIAPILYFEFTSLFSAVIYLSYTRYILATKKKEIQSIVQQALWILQVMPIKKETQKCLWIPIRIKYKAIFLHCVLLLKMLITVVVDLEKNGWNFNSWWCTQEQRFRETFKLTSSYHPIFTWWYGITHIYNSFNFGMADFFLLTVGLIYLELASCFRDSLNEKNSDFQQVMDNYKIIRKVAADISDISGLYIFGYTVSVVAFYVTHLLDIVRPMPFPIRLLYCLQTTYFVAIFYYIAAGNNMMTSFQRWICKQENYRNEKLSVKDLHVTLYELVNYPVAICAPGIFTVSFNLLGKLAGIVLTYTIVALQFRNIS